MSSRPAGVVLTGGRSTRMGVDKATMIVDGKPMAVRVADALWEAGCHPVECQGGDVDTMAEYGLDGHPDREPGEGPVVAIAQAIERHPDTDLVVAACDLVDLDAGTITAIIDRASESDGLDAVVATSGGQRHLVAWLRAGLADRLVGVEAYLELLDALDTAEVEVAAGAVRNLNSPADVEARDNLGDV